MTQGRSLLFALLMALAGLALCGPMRASTPLAAAASGAAAANAESGPVQGASGPARSADATTPGTAYAETVPGSRVTFEMVPVPAQAGERGFWIGRREVTWAEYDVFRADTGARVQRADDPPPGADAITRPTPAYADETFGYGKEGMPALSITHHAAVGYARWLARRTGLPYRLPTEKEWERACRAGGDDEAAAQGRAWVRERAGERPHPVGTSGANGLGIFDLVGNVAEWVDDGSPALYPQVAKGGAWTDPAATAGCGARRVSDPSWNERDPQNPQSIWWHTDATFVGFRLLRPFETN